MSNSFGTLFRITTFGESHGEGIGVVIDGCPAGVIWNQEFIQKELERRKPGQSAIVTQRKESDTLQVLSGIFEGQTTGMPVTLFIKNENAKSQDYEHLKNVYRPSHADYTYDVKYKIRDYRGGGRASARETAARVAAGAVAKLLLKQFTDVQILAWVFSVGDIQIQEEGLNWTHEQIEANIVRCPEQSTAEKMIDCIKKVRKEGDTIGGIIQGLVSGVPPGWGEPVFGKLHAQLGAALLGINAVKGFEYGSGFAGTQMRGSAHNDIFFKDEKGTIRTHTNFSGGVQGGISNGEAITFKVAFKPVATLQCTQATIDTAGNYTEIIGKGRHDPCVLPRAVPVVEAMVALVLADAYLLARSRSC